MNLRSSQRKIRTLRRAFFVSEREEGFLMENSMNINLKIKEMPMVFIHEEPIKFEVNNNQVLQGREI